MVPGERRLGLMMNQSVRDNILLPNLDALSRVGCGSTPRPSDRLVSELMELVDIRPRRPELKAGALSGGNQQKVILAKWLARRVGVLLLEEPTQGIDVAAKTQIHNLIGDFVTRGGGVLVNSTDLDELAQLCDTVLAVRQGRDCGFARSRRRPRRAEPARGDRRVMMRDAHDTPSLGQGWCRALTLPREAVGRVGDLSVANEPGWGARCVCRSPHPRPLPTAIARRRRA